jgi:hypothetical protein
MQLGMVGLSRMGANMVRRLIKKTILLRLRGPQGCTSHERGELIALPGWAG